MGSFTPTGNIRIGVDVGGTNTDAVALDLSAQHTETRGVIAHFKTPTTPDVTSGIETAVGTVIKAAGVSLDSISCVTIGTTHFINAVIEQDARRLRKVGVLRLSKSFLRQIPPFSEFPAGLTRLIRSYIGYADGGLHIDGAEEAPVVEDQVVRECAEIKKHGISALVVAGIFSPIDEEFQQEKRVRDIILREIPGIDVVCSHEVSNIGFLERENAAILNASILKYGRRTVRGFREAMSRLDLKCGLYITQNDGTLLDAASAARMPIRTFSSGATNSMRGAAYLAGKSLDGTSAVVVDIGGTTSDAGVLLQSGFPRQASAFVTVAGVKVNYSMPFLHSIGLGGGSIVREAANGKVTVGPDSVGHYLTTEAKVFGGSKLTATDIAVAAKRAVIGDISRIGDVSPELALRAQDRIKAMLEGVIDLCKTSPDPLPVLLVGGGSVLAPESLKGASKIICPPFHDVANAVGAAVSKVGGVVDLVQSTEHQTQQEAIQRAKDLAIKRAMEAGAIPQTITITEIDSLPVSYVANKLRTVVKAVGELDIARQPTPLEENNDFGEEEVEESKDYGEKVSEESPVDPFTYRPDVAVNPETGIAEWSLSKTDVDWLAEGCYVLGCAGGGSPAATRIQLRDQLREGYRLKIVDASVLPDNARVYWGGHMGSPAVSVERLNATETVEAFRALMEYLRHDSFDAVIGLEIGGANGLEPLLVGSSKYFDRPTIDADFMGRAYPTYWQTTIAVHEPGSLIPCAIDSGDGKTIIMTRASTDEIVDRALRASCAEMGSRVGKAGAPTTASIVRRTAVINTYSLAWRIGRCIARSEASNTQSKVCESIVQEVGGEATARILFRGKIVAVERRLFKGHSYGEISIASMAADEEDEGAKEAMPALATGGTLKIPFKNENLYAEHTSEAGERRMVCTVPDLIAVLDTGSGRALGVPEFRYGLRVTVLGITASPQWTSTEAGVKIGGPKAFGYDLEYKPVGVYVEPKSVIAEYAACE
ncbi:hydantoinase oxoprolinase [Diplodia corticola]|uniref:Hydantoinase oxoprolinase n=1 Tax=Diplodia corticola TaxID=236234 RepID=A0A1J9QM88_9PEZI|nr:hydantoinase oxoprolinase [Diplodia corticola]OJD29585.1 hydantoinase oxoprolinase [Diplodia corticola]